MKNLKISVLIVLGVMITFSCKEDQGIHIQEQISEEDEINLVVEMDNISDDIDNIIDELLGEDTKELLSSKNGNGSSPNCMTRTVKRDDDGVTRTITLEFEDGCKMPSGNRLSGKLILTAIKELDEGKVTITYEFVDFSRNDVKVSGEKTVVRVKKDDGRESTVSYNVNYVWPDDKEVAREGTRTRKFIEGFDTKNGQDNVFSITGNWKAVIKREGKNDKTISAAISEDNPLIRKMTCKYIVQGTVNKVRNGKAIILDYGDGTCNNKATITKNGESREIILRHRNS